MFVLDRAALEQNMTMKGGKLQHNTGNKIGLFPFTANDKKLNDLKDDLTAFKGIAGGCFRECLHFSQQVHFDKDAFLDRACTAARAPENAYLRDILEKVAFDEHDQLLIFSSKIFPYLGHYVKHEILNHIARFLVSVLLDTESAERLKKLAANEPDNLMHRLVLECLPEPKQAEPRPEPFYRAASRARLKFREDLETLTADPVFFTQGFQRLLKLYFFQYVSELAFELNAFFEERTDRCFFSLSWEKLQASRLPIINGWELFEKNVSTMFSHANTLELLNHIHGFEGEGTTYRELRAQVNCLSAADRAGLLREIEAVIQFYRARVMNGSKPFDWSRFSYPNHYQEEPVFDAVYRLWHMVDFQFQETKRTRQHTAYKKWFLEFTKLNFTRNRGRNGYSLSLDKESILFLTRLCIGQQAERIRLSKLWQEMEERGFYFDQISKGVMVEYFEKINLLEKKSDSGDAQYVRKLQ